MSNPDDILKGTGREMTGGQHLVEFGRFLSAPQEPIRLSQEQQEAIVWHVKTRAVPGDSEEHQRSAAEALMRTLQNHGEAADLLSAIVSDYRERGQDAPGGTLKDAKLAPLTGAQIGF